MKNCAIVDNLCACNVQIEFFLNQFANITIMMYIVRSLGDPRLVSHDQINNLTSFLKSRVVSLSGLVEGDKP
ncbi:hypothetical protein Ljor_1096 [Legionella jordanis]|uniref:Uncharacterized protein n=1 Tax=Legionella jordanis TaxID=456 RepID=A0A0W0VAA4_9GAMM|nr:hypothetical protein Ljor_1096 [Legionella jordanis]RMX22255.1 hypothetical protein EAS68_01660 [Legionella jordanis]